MSRSRSTTATAADLIRSFRGIAAAGAVVLVVAACTSSTNVATETPSTSATSSATSSASSTLTPSPSPTPTGPLAITGVPVHNGEIGVGFSPITLTGSGGTGSYTWSLAGGALPGGLTLSAQGVISGSVNGAGTFKFTVALADSGGSHATKSASITVFKTLSVKASCAQTCVVGQGCSKCGGFGSASNGAPPLAYTIVGGRVPAGMKQSGLSLQGGFPAGSYSLTVVVSDAFGARGSVQANWSVYTSAALKGGANCTGFSNTPPQSCTVTWSYSGGSPTTAPQVVVTQVCLPTGTCSAPPANMPNSFSAKASGGVITITAITSVACNAPAYIATLTLVLKDTTQCATTAASNAVDLTINLSNNC